MTKTENAPRSGAIKGPAPVARASSKTDTVMTMLGGEQGATLADLVTATGWQSHTARAVLSGLKKKGHLVQRDRVDGVSRYRILPEAAL